MSDSNAWVEIVFKGLVMLTTANAVLIAAWFLVRKIRSYRASKKWLKDRMSGERRERIERH